jgi:hypothetical protein
VKNKTDRVVVLNDVAESVIDSVRGEHPQFVFTRGGKSLTGMNNSGWKAARRRAAAQFEETLKGPCPIGFRRLRSPAICIAFTTWTWHVPPFIAF